MYSLTRWGCPDAYIYSYPELRLIIVDMGKGVVELKADI
jgi:hypothetical protein